MTIKELVERSFTLAKSKGWRDSPRTPGEDIALIHSELSEALEEIRAGHAPNHTYFASTPEMEGTDPPGVTTAKPEGVPSELADVLIRIGDFCGYHNIDLEEAVKEKLAFNAGRPYRHGGKAL